MNFGRLVCVLIIINNNIKIAWRLKLTAQDVVVTSTTDAEVTFIRSVGLGPKVGLRTICKQVGSYSEQL